MELTKPNRLARILWPLILGLGLTLALLWTLVPRSAVEAQTGSPGLSGEQGSGQQIQRSAEAAQALNPGFTVDLFHDRVWGKVGPGELVTVTGPGGVYGAAQADTAGFFWTPLWDSTTGTEAKISDADTFNFYVDGTLDASITARDVTGQVDVLNDRVTGNIPGVPAGTAVTVTLINWLGGEPPHGAPQETTTTDGSGNLTADFAGSVNTGPRYWATVDYAAGSAVRDHLGPAEKFLVSSYQSIDGLAQPGQTVTATIYDGVSSVEEVVDGTADKTTGGYWLSPNVSSLDPGDLVEVDLGGGTVISTVIADLSIHVDADADVVTGTAPAGKVVRVAFMQWAGGGDRYYENNTTASAGGVYTADFSSQVDLLRHVWVNAAVNDAEGDETWVWGGAPAIGVNPTYDNAWARVDAGNVPMTATLDTGTNRYVWTGTSHPQYHNAGDIWFDDGTGSQVDIQGGHVITIETPTWNDSMVAADITLDFDVNNDRVSGDAPSGYAEVQVGRWNSGRYPVNGWAVQTVTLASPFSVTFPDFDLRFGGWIDVTHYNSDGHWTQVHCDLPQIEAQVPNGVGGTVFVSNEAITGTLYESDGVTVKAQTTDDHDGNPDRFWFGDWSGEQIEPGDWVTVTGASGWEAGVQVVKLSVDADEATDRMSGRAPVGLLNAQWGNNVDDGRDSFVPTDGDGNYLIDWNAHENVNVEWGHYLRAQHIALNGNQVARDSLWPQMRVNYGHDWVGADYPAGHTFWITVTDSSDAAKATAVVSTTSGGGWGGEGFETQWDDWSPSQPDVEPGDWVYARADDGYSNTIRVGEITGTLSVVNDSVGGNIYATWFTQTLNVECHPWGAPGSAPVKNSTAAPDGSSPYFCQWDPATEWDILSGQDVAVMYNEPDGDWVINVFREPVPRLRIEKWANGNPGDGGNMVFQVQYQNEGDAPAENTVITDTMLGGMTYLTDTSGFPHTGSGSGPIVWDLGTVGPSDWIEFEIFVDVTAVASDTVTNTVQIATSNPYDEGEPGEKESWWSGHVEDNDTHLNVDKWAWTGDPAPDTDFVYAVNVCNNGSTDSNQVTLTDTLHPSTTLQSWWAQYSGWTELASSSNMLVVSRPSIPGWRCSEVYLRVHLDESAWTGMSISNTAVISAGNDLEDHDNETTWWGNVNDPHTNLYVNKRWGRGQLVPGGKVSYDIDFGNGGNVPLTYTFRITDTLPASTTFNQAWLHDNQQMSFPITPTVITNDYVVWEVDGIDNGYGVGFGVELDVDYGATPGTVLTNTVEISPQPDEDRYDDNVSIWVETLYDHGPNLRVRKEGGWDDWGDTTRRASYDLTVENIGDATVMPVVITDTYDNRMYLDGGVGSNYWGWWDWRDDPANHSFTVTLEALYPGESVNINFSAITDTEPLPFGLVFTNTAEVTLDPADVNPADNVDDAVVTTGPDLYVEKRLVAGDLLPGELITVSLRFGNDREGNEWWWSMQGDAQLTDILPDGLEYVSAQQRWCDPDPDDDWCDHPPDVQVGSTLLWLLWSMGAGDRNEIYLTARITDTVEGDDVLINQVEIASDQPLDDIEPYYDNNRDTYDVAIALPYYQVGKIYQSNKAAGAVVTYTLTVTNIGHAPGTNVTLRDTLPTNLTYGGSDGTPGVGAVTWEFGSIAANGGTATGWFSGEMGCTAGQVVNNQFYRVVSSDQGVTSLDGAPVSFTTVAPTINPSFDQSASTIDVNTTIAFTNTSTTNGASIANWTWNFGDGGTGTGATTSHVYTASGVYSVTLTIADACGFSNSLVVPDAVTVRSLTPEEFFIYLPVVMRNH